MYGEQFRGRLWRLVKEPPCRLLAKHFFKSIRAAASTRAYWDASDRPAYLLGLDFAAYQARCEEKRAISVLEFGVAGGQSLVVMEREAAAVSRESGVAISVFGFDNASGLPSLIGDHRDHPDIWQPGDYPMDEAALRARLDPATRLELGNVAETLPRFLDDESLPPIGFIAFDLDLYSSTSSALAILNSPRTRALRRLPLVFDDDVHFWSNPLAGELLAISEFNSYSDRIKIFPWRGLADRPFPEAAYLEKMYMAHDLPAISQMTRDGPVARLDLER